MSDTVGVFCVLYSFLFVFLIPQANIYRFILSATSIALMQSRTSVIE